MWRERERERVCVCVREREREIERDEGIKEIDMKVGLTKGRDL